MSKAYFGIDLGTTNSSIAYVTADLRNTGQRVQVTVVKMPEDRAGRHKSDRAHRQGIAACLPRPCASQPGR